MAPGDPVLVHIEEHVCTITINRPEHRNALDPPTVSALIEALQSVGNDEKVRAVVLRGASQHAFCSGFEITRSRGAALHPGPSAKQLLEAVESCPCPIIAMIYGYAIAGGLALALACDFRLAAENARLGMTMAKIGVVYPPDMTDRLIAAAGLSNARRLLFTGRLFSATETREMRLVDEVVPLGQLEKATYDLAGELVENSPLSLRTTKAIITRLLWSRFAGGGLMDELSEKARAALASDDAREGRLAFLEKRKPVFRGK